MKRLFFPLIAVMLLGGPISAQTNHYTYNYHDFEHKITIVAQIMINGVEQTSSDFEIGAFDASNNVTGSALIGEYGSNHYHRAYFAVFYNKASDGPYYTYRLYNHETGEELTNYTITDHLGTPLIFEWSDENGYGTNKKPVIFNFVTTSSQTFTKEITGYGNDTIGGYYLIATPIDDVNPAEIDGMIATPAGNYDFYWFDQTQNLEWINYKAGVFNMVSGMGYLYANKNDVTLTFTGTPIDGPTYEVSLVKDDDAEFPGWNLVGNPFAEHTAYIDRDCYVMNPEGRFEIIATNTRSIDPMEGAFVIAAENDEPLVFSTEGSAKGSMITLNLSGPSTSSGTAVIDRAIVRFGEGRQLPKFQLRESSTKVYIPVGNQDYAVVCSEGMGEIPVNFKAENNGSYTLSFDSEEVNFNYLHLIDNMTSVETDLLANPSYCFEARTTDYESRFKLVFATNSIGENAEGDNETFAFFSNGSFVISNEGEATLQVIDVNGHILKSESINGCGNVNVNAAAGVYLFRLVNGDSVKVQKVVVR